MASITSRREQRSGFGYLLCADGGLFVCARFAALWSRIKGRSARSAINTATDVATCVQHRLSRAALDSALLPVVYSFIHYFSSKGNLLIFVHRDRVALRINI